MAVLTNGALLACRRCGMSSGRRPGAALPGRRPGTRAFRAVNRPLAGYPSAGCSGLEAFRRESPGHIWLEMLLLRGSTTREPTWRPCAGPYAPWPRTRCSSTPRCVPGVEATPRALTLEALAAIAGYLGGRGRSRGDRLLGARCQAGRGPRMTRLLVEMLARRPMTAADLAGVLGCPCPWCKRSSSAWSKRARSLHLPS